MTDDKAPYLAIGRTVNRLLPKDWSEAIFRVTVTLDGPTWSLTCLFGESRQAVQRPDILAQEPTLTRDLESIRGKPIFPKGTCEIIFRHDFTYEVRAISPIVIPNLPDLQTINRLIEDLEALVLESVSIDRIKELLTELIKGYRIITPIIQTDAALYRGRKFTLAPTRILDLTYPPCTGVRSLHRAGREGQSLFYCSLSRHVPFFELDLVPGDNIAISTWRLTAPVVVNNLGFDDEALRHLGSNRDSPAWGRNVQAESCSTTNALIGRFLAKQFVRRVSQGNEHLYKISIALAEKHLYGPQFGGLLYPSIKMQGNADNLALKPECADKHLTIIRAEYFRVDAVDDSSIRTTLLDFADTFDARGVIEWQGRLPRWSLEIGASLSFSSENGQWVARNQRGEIVQPE